MSKKKVRGRDRSYFAMWADEWKWLPEWFVPAWSSFEEIDRRSFPSFDVELSSNVPQAYLPLYVNNRSNINDTYVVVLEFEDSDSSVGFSQESYVLKNSWDSTPDDADIRTLATDESNDPSILTKMFLVDGDSKPNEVPKLVLGGRFSQTVLIFEGAQSKTVQLDEKDNVYVVESYTEILKFGSFDRSNDDSVYGGSGNDQIDGGKGGRYCDLFGEAGNDILRNGDYLNGGSGDDVLYSLDGYSTLEGMSGNDVLYGYTDVTRGFLYYPSILYGGDGIDFLTGIGQIYGGTGADRFDFYNREDGWTNPSDFLPEEGDKIGIYVGTSQNSIFRNADLPINATITPSQFHVGAAAADADDRFIYYDGVISFDADGIGPISPIGLFYAGSNLTYTDIVTFDDSNRLPPSSSPLPPAPSVQFSQLNYRGNESEETATITLARSGSILGRSQVQLNITGGTATAGSDYDATGFPQVITFDVEEESVDVEIPIALDDLEEATESITFSITPFYDPKAGTLETEIASTSTATLQILNESQSEEDFDEQPIDESLSIPTNGNDVLTGTGNPDRMIGLDGDDTLIGEEGSDLLVGGAGNDKLFGGSGNDTLKGEVGKDWLYGGVGNDKMFGGKQRDVFVLEKGKGVDQIMDFEDKVDRIGLLPKIKFKQLEIVAKGRNTLLSFGNDQLAVIKNIQADQITKSDFVAVKSSVA